MRDLSAPGPGKIFPPQKGLGIKNMQATNRSLILAAAWTIAENPNSHLAKVLQSKYCPYSSIWRVNPNTPKSTFWTSIIKVRPMLINNSFFQIITSNISLSSSPWFNSWENIYDHVVIPNNDFKYPALVKHLWLPNHKKWDDNLIDMLFEHNIADIMKQVPIIQMEDDDILCWILTPTRKFNTKSVHKLCPQVRREEAEPQPRALANNTRDLLKRVWKAKDIAPRIQTFAWRLIRKALPTGKRAGKHS
jgi:hypothetical protein